MDWETLAGFAAFFVLGFVASGLQIPEPTLDGSTSGEANIAAVSQDGIGAIGKAKAVVTDGTGRTLVDSDPFVETDTQLSARKAREVAEESTGYSLENKDVTYSYDISGSMIGGPSAGAAMTVATIAAIENKPVDKKAAVTGTITRGGRIGRVGGILEKAEAAGEKGLDSFYVPEGQASITYYERQVVEEGVAPGLLTENIEYIPREFSVDRYTERRFSMSTEEVSDIEELSEEMVE